MILALFAIETLSIFECSSGELIIPEGTIIIQDYQYAYCSNYTGELHIPDTVEIIGSFSFINCSGLYGSLKLALPRFQAVQALTAP